MLDLVGRVRMYHPRAKSVTTHPASLMFVAVVIGVGALVATACGGASGSTGSSGKSKSAEGEVAAAADRLSGPSKPQLPVTVTGSDGVKVTVTDASRIVTLRSSISEAVYSLGLGGSVVGRDVSTTFDEAADVPIVTDGHEIAVEALLSLDPTLVLVDTDTGPPERIKQLRDIGVPVVVFEPVVKIEDIGEHLRLVAQAVGLPERGDELAEKVDGQLAAATQGLVEADQPRVAFLYLRGNAGVYLLGGPGSGADSMIEAAGGIDVGTDMKLSRAFTPLTAEALVTAAPDVLLLTTTGLESVGGIDGLIATPGVAQTPAGRTRTVITIDDGLLYSFGVRTPKAIEVLAKQFAEAAAKEHG